MAGRSRQGPFALQSTRHLRRCAQAVLLASVSFLVALTSETPASSEEQQAQWQFLKMANELSAARAKDANDGGSRKLSEQVESRKSAAAVRPSLQLERERAEQLERNLLALTKRGVETQTSLATKANDGTCGLKPLADSGTAELQRSLQQEHGRADALAQQLLMAAAKISEYEVQARATEQAEELRKAAAESSAGELRKSLQQERARAEQLAQNLASAKYDVETQTALTAKANDEASRLKRAAEDGALQLKGSLRQEEERAEALAQELSTARAKISAYETQARQAKEYLRKAADAESGAVGLRESLQQERGRAEQLEQNLASAKHDLETQTALAAKAKDEASRLKQVVAKANDEANRLKQAADAGEVELRKSLQQERERAERLEQDVAATKRELETQAAMATKAKDEASRLKQVAGSGATDFKQSLGPEHEGAKACISSKQQEDPRDLAPEQSKKDAQRVVARAGTQDNAPMARTTRPIAAAQTTVEEARREARPHAEDSAETAKLVARARVLLGQGDVGSARIVLERAAEGGGAQANFALAETYDPLILAKWGTFATRGDTAKARELYTRAEAGGNEEAKRRLDTLR